MDRRRRIARLVSIGQRVGYRLFGLAVVLFLIGFITGDDRAQGRPTMGDGWPLPAAFQSGAGTPACRLAGEP